MNDMSFLQKWLKFDINDKEYVTSAQDVKEIYPYIVPEPVPGTPENVLGILNIRGEMIVIVSGTKLMDSVSSNDSQSEQIVIFDTTPDPIGITVDKVGELIKPDKFGTDDSILSPNKEFITGTCIHKGKLLVTIDLVNYF